MDWFPTQGTSITLIRLAPRKPGLGASPIRLHGSKKDLTLFNLLLVKECNIRQFLSSCPVHSIRKTLLKKRFFEHYSRIPQKYLILNSHMIISMIFFSFSKDLFFLLKLKRENFKPYRVIGFQFISIAENLIGKPVKLTNLLWKPGD